MMSVSSFKKIVLNVNANQSKYAFTCPFSLVCLVVHSSVVPEYLCCVELPQIEISRILWLRHKSSYVLYMPNMC